MESFNEEQLLTEIGGDLELLHTLASLFLKSAEEELAGIEEALESGSQEEFRPRLHHLKGSLAALNASPAHGLAEALEAHGLQGNREEALRLFPAFAGEVRRLIAELRPLALRAG